MMRTLKKFRVKKAFALVAGLVVLATPGGAQTNATPPRVDVSAPIAVAWSNAPGQFLITRTGDLSTNLTIQCSFNPADFLLNYVAWNGANFYHYATNGVDFALLSDQVIIPAGTNSVALLVRPLKDGDGIEGPAKPAVIYLKGDPGYQVGANSAIVGLLDRDLSNAPAVKIILPFSETNQVSPLLPSTVETLADMCFDLPSELAAYVAVRASNAALAQMELFVDGYSLGVKTRCCGDQ